MRNGYARDLTALQTQVISCRPGLDKTGSIFRNSETGDRKDLDDQKTIEFYRAWTQESKAEGHVYL